MRDLVDIASDGKPEKIVCTAGDLRYALLRAFAPPADRIYFEVANDTGFKAKRWIDAVGCGIWESRGHEFTGIEIKVSRSDWLRELKNPAKAQEMMMFCNRWYVAAPAGMIKPDELPATWGLMEYRGGVVRKKVHGKLLRPVEPWQGFAMALLRQSNAVSGEAVERLVEERVATVHAEHDQRVAREVERRTVGNGDRAQKVLDVAAKLEKLTGRAFNDFDFDVEAVAGYQLLRAAGIHSATSWKGVPGAIKDAEALLFKLKSIFDMPAFQEVRAALAAFEPEQARRR